MEQVCKVCGETFSAKGFHGHLRKGHDLFPYQYYHKYYPRVDKYTNELLPFITYEQYFEDDFASKENAEKWLAKAPLVSARNYILKIYKKRIEEKELKFAPSYSDISTTESLPSFKIVSSIFGSYEELCAQLEIEPLFKFEKPKEVSLPKDYTILIDTREQQPLSFKKSESFKLSFGDYTLKGDDYTYTYIDRKSEQDFKSTVTLGYDRFVREIERAVNLDSYIYVVVESSIADIEKHNKSCAHPLNMKYVWANMRKIQHLFPRKVQFVFSGSRKDSERIIPYLLAYGSELWDKDVQYLISK